MILGTKLDYLMILKKFKKESNSIQLNKNDKKLFLYLNATIWHFSSGANNFFT